MIKKTITYLNWDDIEVSEDFYFNLNEAEILDLEVSDGKEGFFELVKTAAENDEAKVVMEAFKKIIHAAIGRREGNRFIKNQDIVDEFTQTNAYPALLLSMIQNPVEGAKFINGIMPKAAQEALANSKDQLVLDMKAKIEEMAVPTPPVVENVSLPEGEVPKLAADFAAMSPEEFEAWKNSQV